MFLKGTGEIQTPILFRDTCASKYCIILYFITLRIQWYYTNSPGSGSGIGRGILDMNIPHIREEGLSRSLQCRSNNNTVLNAFEALQSWRWRAGYSVKWTNRLPGRILGVPNPDGIGEADPLLEWGTVEEGTSPIPEGEGEGGEEEDGDGSSHNKSAFTICITETALLIDCIYWRIPYANFHVHVRA